MLIEFSCPICQAPLAIKKQAVGGQVNCPKCQKLILLPSESPLPRHETDKPPFHNGQIYPVKEVTQAICASVEPYRRDLDTKTNLLNDAVEMVKIRNERIRELETLMLNTQGELWALEADMEDLEGQEPDTTELDALKEENQSLTEKKDKLKSRLTNMITHSEQMDQSLKAFREVLGSEGTLLNELDAIREQAETQTKTLEQGANTSEEALEWIQKLSDTLSACRARLQAAETARTESAEILKTSEENMQRALDERDQWKARAFELEQKQDVLGQTITKLETRITQAEGLEKDWAQDRETAKNLRVEMEENLQLLRDRIEQEREAHRVALQERETELITAGDKKQAVLMKKLEKAQADLLTSEKKRMDALKTQKGLAEQNMMSEEELGELKRQLQEALDRIEELENP